MRVRSAIDMIAVTHEKVVLVIKICSLIYLIQTAWATLLVCLFTDVEVSSNLKDKRTDNREVKKITCCFFANYDVFEVAFKSREFSHFRDDYVYMWCFCQLSPFYSTKTLRYI